jgi:hypothetical protein
MRDVPDQTISAKSKTLEEKILWMLVGFSVALAGAWFVYPKIFVHYHQDLFSHVSTWSGAGVDRAVGPGPAGKVLLVGILIAGLGFLQLRFEAWFRLDVSVLLLRAFLLFSFIIIVGETEFSFANRFWTIPLKKIGAIEPAMEIGRALLRFGVESSVAVALLNFVYAMFRRLLPSKLA